MSQSNSGSMIEQAVSPDEWAAFLRGRALDVGGVVVRVSDPGKLAAGLGCDLEIAVVAAAAGSALTVTDVCDLMARWLRAKVRASATQGSDVIELRAASAEEIAQLLEAPRAGG